MKSTVLQGSHTASLVATGAVVVCAVIVAIFLPWAPAREDSVHCSAGGRDEARPTAERAGRTARTTKTAGTEELPYRPSCEVETYSAASSRRLRVRFGSTGMPGPVVVETVTFLTYRPFAEDGFARRISSSAAP